jgi:hypothetical protein
MIRSLMVSSCDVREIRKADMAIKLFLTHFAQFVTECEKMGMVTRSDIVLLLQRMDPTSDIVQRKLKFIHWSTDFVEEDGQ